MARGAAVRLTAPLLAHAGPFLLFLTLAALFLAPALAPDRALLPTDLLARMSPWAESAGSATLPEGTGLPWNPLLWDAIAQFYPWRAFAAHWMRQGVIPLWDPHQFCGTPFLANSQSAVLYPLHFLLLYLPTGLHAARCMVLLALAHLTLAGYLTYLFLRAVRVAPFAAGLGGVTYMLSGFVVTWLELPSFLTVACWLPLLLLTLHRLTERPSTSRAAAVGAAVGLLLLGGHLQIAFYCLLGTTVFASCRLLQPELRGNWKRIFGLMLLGGMLGVMIAAPQLLPAVELSRSSHRVSVTSLDGLRAYLEGAMPLWQLIRFFLPDFYGNPTRGRYLAGSPADYTEYAGTISSIGLFLAVAALLSWNRRPNETRAAAIIAVLSLLLALGTPLNSLFYFGIPGFSQSGSPARVLVLFCFSGAWLAAMGAEALSAGLRGLRREAEVNEALEREGAARGSSGGLVVRALVVWAVLLGGSVLAARQFVMRGGDDFAAFIVANAPSLVQVMVLVLLAAGLPLGLERLATRGSVTPSLAGLLGSGTLVALVTGELWLFGAGFNPTGPLTAVYPTTPLIESLADSPSSGGGRVLPVNRRWSLYEHPHAVLPPNGSLAMGLSDPQGYDSLFLGSYKGLSNLIAAPGADSAPPENGNMLFVSNLSSPLLPLLAADRVVMRPDGSGSRPEDSRRDGSAVPPPHRWPVLLEQTDIQVRRVPGALPRAFVARDWRAVPDARLEEGLRELAYTRGLGTTALLSGAGALGARGGRGGAAGLQEEGPSGLRLTAEDGSAPGTLVVLDNYTPGWRATDADTGRPLPLYRAHLTFRGVPLQRGTRVVRMRYEPASFRLGLYLAAMALAAMAIMSVSCLPRRCVSEQPA